MGLKSFAVVDDAAFHCTGMPFQLEVNDSGRQLFSRMRAELSDSSYCSVSDCSLQLENCSRGFQTQGKGGSEGGEAGGGGGGGH